MGSSRKARHRPARRSSAGSVEGVRRLFGNGRFFGEDLESTFSCQIAPSVVQFFRNHAREWTGRRRRLPGRIASSSSRSESTFNPLRNLHSRKEKAFGFCCAGLGFRCGGLGFWRLRLGFWCLRLGNPWVHCGARVAYRQCAGGGRHRRRRPPTMPGPSGAIAAAKSATTAALFTLERVGRPCNRQNRAAQ